MINVADIQISEVTITPAVVTAGASFIISAVIIPRLFAISNAAGRPIKRANGDVISTEIENYPLNGIATEEGRMIKTAKGEIISTRQKEG